jgi:hypothetical protein
VYEVNAKFVRERKQQQISQIAHTDRYSPQDHIFASKNRITRGQSAGNYSTSKVMQNLTLKIGEISEVDIEMGPASYICRQAR